MTIITIDIQPQGPDSKKKLGATYTDISLDDDTAAQVQKNHQKQRSSLLSSVDCVDIPHVIKKSARLP